MKLLIRQISFTTSIIALIATLVGAAGLYNDWGLAKSLNIILSGLTGLIISTSFAVTVFTDNKALRFFQILFSAGLIYLTTILEIETLIYYVLCFQLLWITTLALTISFDNKLHLILLGISIATITLGHFTSAKELIYITAFILLIISGLLLSINATDHSK
ncbi:MAG: hypothetical protein ACO2Z9_05545 [Crocinitomicaceae bacterium]